MPCDSAARSRLALAGEPQLDTFVSPWRDVDRHRLLGADDASTLALGARVADDLPLAVAPIAQRHVDELAKDRLLHAPNLATALAPGALGPLAARLHTTARTAPATGVLDQIDLFGGPEHRLFQREMQVVAQVLATLDALPRATLSGRPEEGFEQILDR